jgi:hypothetical protein
MQRNPLMATRFRNNQVLDVPFEFVPEKRHPLGRMVRFGDEYVRLMKARMYDPDTKTYRMEWVASQRGMKAIMNKAIADGVVDPKKAEAAWKIMESGEVVKIEDPQQQRQQRKKQKKIAQEDEWFRGLDFTSLIAEMKADSMA